ncbi:MAG TPA: hypothetical protein VGW34_14915 [Allosphingosinicella sp.]|nr:hypothetical protein [Allosphingosinicella sp.]
MTAARIADTRRVRLAANRLLAACSPGDVLARGVAGVAKVYDEAAAAAARDKAGGR